MDEEEEEELAERLSVEMLPLRSRDRYHRNFLVFVNLLLTVSMIRNELLQAEILYWDFDPQGISEVLTSFMTIRKAKIILLSPFFGDGGGKDGSDEDDVDDDDSDEDDDDESGEQAYYSSSKFCYY